MNHDQVYVLHNVSFMVLKYTKGGRITFAHIKHCANVSFARKPLLSFARKEFVSIAHIPERLPVVPPTNE